MTALTTISAAMNMPHGDRSRGNVSAALGPGGLGEAAGDEASAGAAGAVGGITGALLGYGVPEVEAKRYEGRIRKGGVLLSVHADSAEWAKRASELLSQTGGQDISTASEAKGDFANSARPQVRI